MKERAGNFSFLSASVGGARNDIVTIPLSLQFDFTGGRVGHCAFYSKCKSKGWIEGRDFLYCAMLFVVNGTRSSQRTRLLFLLRAVHQQVTL